MSVDNVRHQVDVCDRAVRDLKTREARLGRDREAVLAGYDAAVEDGDEDGARRYGRLRVEIEGDLAECPDLITKAERRLRATAFASRSRKRRCAGTWGISRCRCDDTRIANGE